ncbi:HEXXH motif-containing putative peptide modification protein [Actinoplanes sp. NPDC051470]|uniref:aKG-HExxH-type peptide beta-hydroxylase n=1 Tax=Actinoplanes sp. NPDC051470 TaxID=3157224 RepID=UPI00343F0BED
MRRGQHGRNLLLLRALPGDHGAEADLTDPLFGAWAAARLRDRVTGPPPADRPDVRFLTAEHDTISFSVRLEDRDDRRGLLGLTPSAPLTDAEAAHWQECFTDAWRLLVTRHRAAALLLADVLTCVVPVESDAGAAGISATSADAFGAVAMSRPADATGLAVGLLHEAQHSVLNATSYLFDLHLDPRDRGYSPWRDDPRPASGVLHGAYAYLAVTRFWRTEAGTTGDPLATFEFCRWREAVAGTAERLLSTGRLTAAGRRFTGALLDEVRPWPAEPADPRIVHLARLANDDHYVRWRLRNLRPDPSPLVAAFHRGDPPPPPTSQLRTDSRRALSHSPRLKAIHDLLRRGEVVARLSTGAPAPDSPVDNSAELSDPRATLPPTQRGGGGGGGRADFKIERSGGDGGSRTDFTIERDHERGARHPSSEQTRESRLAAVEAALLAGDYGTVRRAYTGKDLDLELTPLIIAGGVGARAEDVAALVRAGCAPGRVIEWIVG